jgi:hypothetical protein
METLLLFGLAPEGATIDTSPPEGGGFQNHEPLETVFFKRSSDQLTVVALVDETDHPPNESVSVSALALHMMLRLQNISRLALIFRCLSSSPFKGEVRRGMGLFWRPCYPIPTPTLPLKGREVFSAEDQH